MRPDRSTRGQSTVIGAILLFGIVIIALAGYQAVAVPAQNQGAEYDHNQVVQTDMHDLRNAILNVRATEGPLATTVQLGTNYPLRVVTLNPPPPAGHLSTVEPESPIHIEHARVDGAVEGDASVLFEEHETRFLTYSPQYNEYHTAPRTTFEHSLLYNRFPNTDLALTAQQLVDGNDITITLLSGDLSHASAESISVDARVADGPTDRIPIESDGSPITIQLPTQSPQLWTHSIGTTFSDGEPNARIINSDATSVTIELAEDGEPYSLQVARVSVGDDPTPPSDKFDIQTDPPTDDSSESTYDVQWDPEALAEASGITYDATTDTLEIDRDQTGDRVTIGASVTASGAPVDGADVEFAATNASVLEFGSHTAQTDAAGDVVVELNLTTTGNTRIFAAAGDDVDPLTVSVTGDTSSGAFTVGSVSVSDLAVETTNQEQRFTFTVANELPAGETVTIDLRETTGAISYANGNGQYSVQRGSGSVTRVSGGIMTYTAGPSDDAGDTIELLVEKVETSDTVASTYTVTFTRSDGGREEATFSVLEREPGSRQINTPTSGDVSVTGDVVVNSRLEGSVNAGGSVTVNSNGYVEGSVDADGSVTVNANSHVEGPVDAGGSVAVRSNGYVGSDVSADGDVRINSNGRIDGSVDANGKVTIDPNGSVGGDVLVENGSDLVCNGGAINGQSCRDYKAAHY